jgi:diguanylate cyclase (GGDEF)-like protein
MMEMTTSVQRILVIGAGRGGTAMLDLFLKDPMIMIVGIIDINPAAPGMEVAKKNSIPTFTNLDAALAACRPCMALNLSTDDDVTVYVEGQLGSKNVIGGFQARFLWKLITRLKKTNEQVLHLAHHDTLTGLPNRILFYDRLNQAMARARRDNELIGILYLDLDGFKLVNDTQGHNIGDALLREASKRIMECIRDSDTVARMGGDEFTVILCNGRTPEHIDRVARKIIDAIDSPFLLDGKSCSVSVSIGISFYPNHGETPDQLVKIADSAMYKAKQSGKNCCRTAELVIDHTL